MLRGSPGKDKDDRSLVSVVVHVFWCDTHHYFVVVLMMPLVRSTAVIVGVAWLVVIVINIVCPHTQGQKHECRSEY